MIRSFLALVAFTWSLSAAAQPVSFSFSAVPLMDFAQATYRNLLGRDFVIASDLVGMGKRVTVSVKAIDPDQVPVFIENVLRAHGVSSVSRGGVYFLELAGTDTARPVDLAQLVRPSSFASSPSLPVAAPGASVDPAPQSMAAQPVDDVEVVVVRNRPASFMVEALNAAFASSVARPVGGSRVAIAAQPDRLKVIRKLVDQLDVAAPVIEVSASFVEVTRSGSNARGLSLIADAVGSRLDGVGVSLLPGDGRLSIRAGRYDLVLDALASDGRFKQVSNSRLVGDDAQQLSLSVGDETPTISSSSRDQSGNAIQNVVYRQSGVILDVTPRVLGSGRVALSVDGQVSSFQATTNGVTGSPTLVKRQVKTSVSVDDGQVLVIGGLDDSKSSGVEAGFSFLPDSWRNKSGNDSKTDLVLILSARVLPPLAETLAN